MVEKSELEKLRVLAVEGREIEREKEIDNLFEVVAKLIDDLAGEGIELSLEVHTWHLEYKEGR